MLINLSNLAYSCVDTHMSLDPCRLTPTPSRQFCARANQAGIQVVNQARQGSVTGPLVGSTGSGAASSSLFGGSFSILALLVPHSLLACGEQRMARIGSLLLVRWLCDPLVMCSGLQLH